MNTKVILTILVLVLVVSACTIKIGSFSMTVGATATPTITPTSTLTPTATPTPKPTLTPTPVPSPTPDKVLGIDIPIVVLESEIQISSVEEIPKFKFGNQDIFPNPGYKMIQIKGQALSGANKMAEWVKFDKKERVHIVGSDGITYNWVVSNYQSVKDSGEIAWVFAIPKDVTFDKLYLPEGSSIDLLSLQ